MRASTSEHSASHGRPSCWAQAPTGQFRCFSWSPHTSKLLSRLLSECQLRISPLHCRCAYNWHSQPCLPGLAKLYLEAPG